MIAQFRLVENKQGARIFHNIGMGTDLPDGKFVQPQTDPSWPGINAFRETGLRILFTQYNNRIDLDCKPRVDNSDIILVSFREDGMRNIGPIGSSGEFISQDIPSGGGLRLTVGDIGALKDGEKVLCLDLVDPGEAESDLLREAKEKYNFKMRESDLREKGTLLL